MSETDRILWQAEIMRKFGSETGSERNANRTVRSSEINIDVVSDEIGTLQRELSCSDDPAAQKRIKELIDERENTIGEIEFSAACEAAIDEEGAAQGSTRLAPAPHRLKTCDECGSLIDAAEIGEKVDIFVCIDCDATIIFPPGVTRGVCPFVFRCVLCGSFTEYDTECERYSCQNSECDNFNSMKRPEDIDFGDYYSNPLEGYEPEASA